ncbi:MAG: hypothetical protein BA873_11300 [Desulfobulbaceae bacterium C00003063]|nr:MAG: hypothetical protein BA873_11300 [Desulfobulbaceae bacterium C00003063]
MYKIERISLKDHFAAEEALIERQRKHLEKRKQFVFKIDEIDKEYRKEILALIGEEKVKKALPRHKKLLGELERPILFDASSEGLKKEEEFRQRIITERHELYRSLRYDHEKAIKIRQEYLKETISATEQYLDIGEKPEYVSKNIEKVPKTDNPWSHYVPPYSDEWGTSGSGSTRGTCWGSHSENRWTGAINCWSYNRVVGADDSDNGWTTAMSEVWVWFSMPAAGLVEVVAVLQDTDTNLNGRLRDESGCSDGNVRQLDRAYLWTSGGTERYQLIRDHSVRSDGGDRSWNIPLTSPGDFIYPHIFSSESYTQGQSVLVAIGVQDDTSFRVNDMSVDPSRVTSRYFVKDIYVRSTGAP